MSIIMGFFQIPSDSLNVVLFNEMIKMQSMLSSQNTMEALPSTGHRSVPSPAQSQCLAPSKHWSLNSWHQ